MPSNLRLEFSSPEAEAAQVKNTQINDSQLAPTIAANTQDLSPPTTSALPMEEELPEDETGGVGLPSVVVVGPKMLPLEEKTSQVTIQAPKKASKASSRKTTSKKTPEDVDAREEYVIQTSQEVDALMRAAADGRTGAHWVTDENGATRSHSIPGAPHHVQIALSENERAQGVSVQVLEKLTLKQDPDFNFVLLYVSQILAPPSPLPRNAAAMGWVDIDDVMSKIGWDPRSSKDRLEMRRRVWQYILFGARASIVGQRSGRYVDNRTGERIETIIDAPPWAVLEREKPAQPQLFPDIQETPLRVRLVASQAWTRLTTAPETAQYLPMGELLGGIPGNRASGAWARVLGLALANFWRRQPHAALEGSLRPTRRELLERYTPKTAPPHEVLGGKNPIRALEYWHGALHILVESGFLAHEGEAALSRAEMRAKLPRQEWQETWLNESVELRPGFKLQLPVQACASALPKRKPRELGGKVIKKQQRSKKQGIDESLK